jgi:hypothetical protein
MFMQTYFLARHGETLKFQYSESKEGSEGTKRKRERGRERGRERNRRERERERENRKKDRKKKKEGKKERKRKEKRKRKGKYVDVADWYSNCLICASACL